MTRVGRSMKRRCVALVTDMNQPLGDTVGTSLEVKEAIQLLKGEGPEDMKELVLKLGMEIVRLAGVAGSTLSAKQTVERHLTDGTALEKLKELVKAQGGDPSYIDDPEKFPKAKYIRKLPAPKRGYVHTINAAMIARGVHLLGAGKEKHKHWELVYGGGAVMALLLDAELSRQSPDAFRDALRRVQHQGPVTLDAPALLSAAAMR